MKIKLKFNKKYYYQGPINSQLIFKERKLDRNFSRLNSQKFMETKLNKKMSLNSIKKKLYHNRDSNSKKTEQ